MQKKQTNTSSDILKSLFHRSEKGFLRVLKARDLLTAEEKKQLKINSKSPQKAVLKALESLLTPPYRIVTKGRSCFILNKTLQDTLLEYIAQESGKTIGEIAKAFPLKQVDLIKEASKLVDQGTVILQIQPKQKIELRSIELHFQLDEQQSKQIATEDTTSSSKTGSDPVQTFKAAYDHADPGSHFVKIFKIRRHLGLPREEFDNLLKTLANDEYLTLNMGNPGKLTREEVQDSFQDEYGDLYITVTWR